MTSPVHLLYPLEARRLLSLAPVGTPVEVPVPTTELELDYYLGSFDVALAGDGSYLVATGTQSGASPLIVRAVRYSPQGEQLEAPLTLATPGSDVSAAMDADGDAVVAYRADSGIEVRRVSKSGVVAEPLRVSQVLAADEWVFSPAVSMDDSGGFFVGWISESDAALGVSAVHIRAFDAGGAPRAAEFIAHSDPALTAIYDDLDLDANPDGSGAVFAHHYAGETPGGVTIGRVNASGLIDERAIDDTDGPGEADAPRVAVRSDGSFVVAYARSQAADESQDAFVQRFSAAGVEQGAPIVLAEGLSPGGEGVITRASAVDVDVMPDGGFVTSFVYEIGGSSVINNGRTLYVRPYDAAGAPVDAVDAARDQSVFGFGFSVVPPVIAAARNEATVLIVHGQGNPERVFAQPFTAEVAVIQDSILHASGSGSADTISVRAEGGLYIVERNGVARSFDASLVRALRITAYGGSDVIVNDSALKSTLEGGSGNDTIRGGLRTDIIHGELGDDFLLGNGGEDRIYGFAGNDSLSGGDGRDLLYGEAGKDSLSGNAGYDFLDGGAGADRVAGNGGRDRLYGGGANDRIYGGAQADSLFGGGGDDQLNGDGGNDRLDGADDGAGDDTLYGGTGDDVLVALDAHPDHLFGGRGNDVALADEDDDLLAGVETTA